MPVLFSENREKLNYIFVDSMIEKESGTIDRSYNKLNQIKKPRMGRGYPKCLYEHLLPSVLFKSNFHKENSK